MYLMEDIVWFQKFNRPETDKITYAHVTGKKFGFGGFTYPTTPIQVFSFLC